jgi:hypothetical protein
MPVAIAASSHFFLGLDIARTIFCYCCIEQKWELGYLGIRIHEVKGNTFHLGYRPAALLVDGFTIVQQQ